MGITVLSLPQFLLVRNSNPRQQAMWVARAWGLPRRIGFEIKNEERALRDVISPCPQPTPGWPYARRRMMPLSEPSRRWRFVGSKARLVSVPRKFSELSFVVA